MLEKGKETTQKYRVCSAQTGLVISCGPFFPAAFLTLCTGTNSNLNCLFIIIFFLQSIYPQDRDKGAFFLPVPFSSNWVMKIAIYGISHFYLSLSKQDPIDGFLPFLFQRNIISPNLYFPHTFWRKMEFAYKPAQTRVTISEDTNDSCLAKGIHFQEQQKRIFCLWENLQD